MFQWFQISNDGVLLLKKRAYQESSQISKSWMCFQLHNSCALKVAEGTIILW